MHHTAHHQNQSNARSLNNTSTNTSQYQMEEKTPKTAPSIPSERIRIYPTLSVYQSGRKDSPLSLSNPNPNPNPEQYLIPHVFVILFLFLFSQFSQVSQSSQVSQVRQVSRSGQVSLKHPYILYERERERERREMSLLPSPLPITHHSLPTPNSQST